MKKLLLIFFAAVTVYTASYGQDQVDQKSTFSILFVGNSLTYTNDLPKLVKNSALAKGIALKVKMLAQPNYAIVDHWNEGKVQKLIKSKKYDYVIIQQGPSSQSEGRRMLIDDGKSYKELCDSSGSQLCYFMVWPSVSRNYTFDNVIKNHKDAASINNSILLPVGQAWKAHIDSSKSFDFYGPDGFHPSLKGSLATAELIVGYLFEK